MSDETPDATALREALGALHPRLADILAAHPDPDASPDPAVVTPDAEATLAVALMTAMGCKVEDDSPECPSCVDGYCSGHGTVFYCTEHDWHEDDNAEGVCGYAVMLARAILASDWLASRLAAAREADRADAATALDAVSQAEVEAAARALYLEEENASGGFDAWPAWDHDDNVARDLFRENARAALEAARIARHGTRARTA